MSMNIVALVGSLRQGSLNRALLHATTAVAPAGMKIELLEIGDVPLYNGDVQSQGFPEVVTRLGEAIRQADGVLLITPRVQLFGLGRAEKRHRLDLTPARTALQ